MAETRRTAIVTGAGRGLGFGLVQKLLEQGWRVIAATHGGATPALAELGQQAGDRLLCVTIDIGDTDSVRAAAAAASSWTEQLDLIVNNAGVLGDIDKQLPDELDFDEMLHVMNVNTLGPLRVTQAFGKLLLRSQRPIVANISSEAGSVGICDRDGWYGYCMSKAALNMQSALVHNQLKPLGGRVLVLHPGWVQSYMHGDLNTSARLTIEQSADNVIGAIMKESDWPDADGKPPYIDTEYGQRLPW
ncbi:short-chain dehydrogenase/reductase SDR [Paenibacillus curdlanolyticus YK9]|uniref:Short-chain dehydrogenase/reductase SDR n=1 Tax=Paenibacillus curdlanolyticus YK9 TaxID=717606 RepID=E0I7L9_9BACL|nr:SDR family NAD(P)-dependent oxidoreductase [Paenibacillus curdlanolyticus]EFM11174.1 short-chain dehydrogenase/reductase SDR [Paenibacillus curdlanolyticus YK9]